MSDESIDASDVQLNVNEYTDGVRATYSDVSDYDWSVLRAGQLAYIFEGDTSAVTITDENEQVACGDVNFLSHTLRGGFVYADITVYIPNNVDTDTVVIDDGLNPESEPTESIFGNRSDSSSSDGDSGSAITYNYVLLFYDIYSVTSTTADAELVATGMPLGIYVVTDEDGNISSASVTTMSESSGSGTSQEIIIAARFAVSTDDSSLIIESASTDTATLSTVLATFGELADTMSNIIYQKYSNLTDIKSYLTEFTNSRKVNVPYVIGDAWYVNGKYVVDVNTSSTDSSSSTGSSSGSSVTASASFSSGMKLGSVTVDDETTSYYVPYASSNQCGVIRLGTGLTATNNYGTVGIDTSIFSDYISASASFSSGLALGSTTINDTTATYYVPYASADQVGVVKIGSGLSIDDTGVVGIDSSTITTYIGSDAIVVSEDTNDDNEKTISLTISDSDNILSQDENGLIANISIEEQYNSDGIVESYNIVGKDDIVLGSIGASSNKIYEVSLGHVDDTIDSSTGTITSGSGNDAILIVYLTGDLYDMLILDVSTFIRESDCGNGLTVDKNGIVSVVIDNGEQNYISSNSSDTYVSVSSSGLNFDNLISAVLNTDSSTLTLSITEYDSSDNATTTKYEYDGTSDVSLYLSSISQSEIETLWSTYVGS